MPYSPNLPMGLRPRPLVSRAPRLEHLVTPNTAPVGNATVGTLDWARSVAAWPMCLNDKIGSCAIAGVAHAVQVLGVIGGAERIMTDAEVETNYERFGYVPGPQGRDPGCVLEDVLTAWWETGLLVGGAMDKIDAFASMNVGATILVRRALAQLGVVIMGAAMPIAAQSQTVWDAPASLSPIDEPGTWGGHCMLLVEAQTDDNPDNLLTFITWGGTQQATWRWWRTYAVESHAIFSPIWAQAGSVSGFDAKAAADAVAELNEGVNEDNS